METDASLSDAEAEARTEELVADIERLGERIRFARAQITKVILGQTDVVDDSLVTLLAGGHALLVGVPGLAKTKLVETAGKVLGLSERRVQFTPDLMPADIIGSEVLEESDTGRRNFRFIEGPVFSQLLMADEINRASPRTQSALLQAMQEGRVSVAGQYHALPTPFHVLATQNPLEHEGTYPLPEAQLDRFLMQIDVGYPDRDSERRMMVSTTGAEETAPEQVMTAEELQAAQHWCGSSRLAKASWRRFSRSFEPGVLKPAMLSEVTEYVGWGQGHGQSGVDVDVPCEGLDRRSSLPVCRRCRGACQTGPAASHGVEIHGATFRCRYRRNN